MLVVSLHRLIPPGKAKLPSLLAITCMDYALVRWPAYFERFLQNRKLLLIAWGLMSLAILGIDYITGPDIAFSFFFLIPVVFAARFNGRMSGILLAVVLPVIRFFFHFVWADEISLRDSLLNVAIRTLVLVSAALLVDRVTRQAIEIQVLRGYLPICSVCKKIRDSNEKWSSVETYITKHSEATFSHTLCPECGKEHYSEWLTQGTISDKIKSSN